MSDILYLAALHYNEDAARDQATLSSGDPLYRMHFPKYRKGECRVKPIKTETTFRYVEDLGFIMGEVFVDQEAYREELLKISIPPDLSSEFEHPEKEEVIANYVSRFNPGEAV
ncbi:hypothetical protein AALO_G00251400 [Alosa alosa]|uniref:Uncharacterized protein n=1 Tax=Alosa alosa TaxID=278164 RepID=A0AAV6FSQ9_9TELE|nr:hypothetical protein AALO_G00251400 [Alosa alosa]